MSYSTAKNRSQKYYWATVHNTKSCGDVRKGTLDNIKITHWLELEPTPTIQTKEGD